MNRSLFMIRRALPVLSVLLVTLFSTTSLSAQNGWQLLAQDDHLKARHAFEQALEVDSLDERALKGMLVLTELHGDARRFEQYLTRLITNYWEEPLYRIFENDYEGSDTLIDASPMSEGAKVGARFSLGWEHFRFYNHKAADSLYRTLVPENRWSLIGPFKNVAGSGYVTEYPVEKERFRFDAVYEDEAGIDLKWIRPTYTRHSGRVEFSDHLSVRENGVCYANTFLDLPEGGLVQLRLTRSAPVTVWVDDAIVYTDRDRIGYYYDGEIIQLNLSAGTHRILVKLSPYYGFPSRYDLLELNSYSWSVRFNQTELCLRVTDSEGFTVPGAAFRYDGQYTPTAHTATVQDMGSLEYFRTRVESDSEDLFARYALCRAYMALGKSEEGEEYFLQRVRNGEDNVVMRWLLARLYAINGKIEKTYATLDNIDVSRTPVFGLMFEKFEQIDLDNEEERYLSELGKLKEIASSSYQVISAYLNFYSQKDMNVEKDAFIDETIAEWPVYEKSLERQKSDYKRRSEVDERTPGEIVDSLMTSLKTEFDIDAYDEAIDYYTDKEELETVLRLYDEVIEALPYWTRYQYNKAEYLVEEKRYEEAIDQLNKVLEIFPYSVYAYEEIGDAWRDKGDNAKALKSYRQALQVASGNVAVQEGWSENSLVEKIDNLSNASSPRQHFQELSFESALASESWRSMYQDEESVILLYTKEQLMDTVGRIRSWHRMMVAILTEAGADWWTEYDFGFMGSINKVKVLKASGGEVVPDRRGGYVVFKDLKPGDIIQLEGVVEEGTDNIFDNEYYDFTWLSFGASIHRARVEMLVPKGKYLGYRHHNLEDNLKKTSANGFDSYLWDYSDLKREPFEDAMLDDSDGDRTIFVSTMQDWSPVVDWYLRKTYRRNEAPYDVREALDSIATAGMTDAQKVEAVYNYITRKINYSYVPFFQSAYTPQFPGITLSGSIGDCKDVATLMIAMLTELGVKSYYTLVKTNYFNHQKFLPSPLFDHAIVAASVDGQMRYMDLTTNFYPHYALPEGNCGAWALLIKEGETEIFRLPFDEIDPAKNLIEIDVEAELDTSRAIELNVKALHRGIAGGNIREGLVQLTKDEMRNYIQELLGKGTFQDLRLIDYTFDKQFEISLPLESRYEFSGSRFSDRVSNLFIFRIPYMLAIRSSQALQSSDRRSRLDVATLCDITPSRQSVSVRFPEGYQLTEVPDDIYVESPFGVYQVTFTPIDNGLRVEKYQEFRKSWINPEEFEDFREFYLRILDIDEARYAILRQKS